MNDDAVSSFDELKNNKSQIKKSQKISFCNRNVKVGNPSMISITNESRKR